MKKITKRLLFIFLLLLLVTVICWLRPFYVVPILNYHSINPRFYNDTPVVSPEVFAKQMEFIHKKGYKVISLDEYIQKFHAGERMRDTVVITLDDGYEDNYTYALPVFKKYHFPATIFLIVNHINKPRFLKIEQIREMAKENVNFGSHTINHRYLPAVIDEEELKSEIFDSKRY